jgi:hypothetical protein
VIEVVPHIGNDSPAAANAGASVAGEAASGGGSEDLGGSPGKIVLAPGKRGSPPTMLIVVGAFAGAIITSRRWQNGNA